MQRMKWWKLLWLVSFVSLEIFSQKCLSEAHYSDFCCLSIHIIEENYCAMECVNKKDICLTDGDHDETIEEIMNLAKILEETPLGETELMACGNFGAQLCKLQGNITGFGISKCMVGSLHELYDRRLVGLSVQGKDTLGLQRRVNITMELTNDVLETHEPLFHFSSPTKDFSQDDCLTLWTTGQRNIACSCDHSGYFGVIMAPRVLNARLRRAISSIEDAETTSETFKSLKSLEERLEETDVDVTKSLYFKNVVALLHKPNGTFRGLTIYANETQAAVKAFPNSIVIIHLPSELDTGPNNKIVFSLVELPEKNKNMFGSSHELYERRLVGLSVQGKTISGLQERVNITMSLTKDVNETQELSCQVLNFSTNSFSEYGCLTLWTRSQSHITCSCDNLAYVGVFMIPSELNAELMKGISSIEDAETTLETFKVLKNLEERLEETEVNDTTSFRFKNVVALLHKPNGTFRGLTISASETQAAVNAFPSSTMIVHLPKELDTGPNNKIAFSIVELPEKSKNVFGSSHELYGQRLVGLSVQGKTISGLQERVNITMEINKDITETQELSCQFLNFSGNSFSEYGCLTLWTRGQSHITCSCDHFTYFGVLLVPSELRKAISSIEDSKTTSETSEALKNLEERLEEIDVNGTKPLNFKHGVALLHKPSDTFRGLTIYASETQAEINAFPSSIVIAHLPSELDTGPNNKIVFSMIKLPEKNKNMLGSSHELYGQRLVGLSVQGKNISGLQERVNITMGLTKDINESQELSCQFLNFSTNKFSQYGCLTLWTRGQSNVTCSCDHLTYFGVLMVPASLLEKDRDILTYISLMGCSLSLLALVITVLLFITNRKLREDVSMKVHINLVFALILLNLHFLPNQAVAPLSSPGLCLYMALGLHYSLLATFSWMALEGFHLYLLVVKVFDRFITRYLLKLSVVGWGVPALVLVVVNINGDFYGRVPLDMSNNTAICYINNDKIKMVTTMGPFSLVFLFNIIVYGVTIRQVLNLSQSNEFGRINRDRARQSFCPLMGVSALLGLTWGLVFFSFGHLTIVGLYTFCILNSLQGFFVFLWFVRSLRKAENSAPKTSTETRTPST